MKFLLMSAAALAFAAPVAAQTATRTPPHQGHAQPHAHASGVQPTTSGDHAPHQEHGGSSSDHGKKCCDDANGNGKMDCCEGAQAEQRPQPGVPAPSN